MEPRAGVCLRQLKDCRWTWPISLSSHQPEIVSSGPDERISLSVCVTLSRVRFVEVSINQWHHRGPSSGSLSFGSEVGRRAARVVFVLFLDESVVAFCFFFCYLSGRTCALSKVRRRLRRSLVTMTTSPLSSLRGRVAESFVYIRLNDCRQRRERALVRGRAAVDDTVHASRDRSWTTQGSHQRRSHLRVPWQIWQLCPT